MTPEVASPWSLPFPARVHTILAEPAPGGQMANFTGLAAARHHVLRSLLTGVKLADSLAGRFAQRLTANDHVEILNDVVLNQVLVRFHAPDGDHDSLTNQMVGLIQQQGTCWMSGTSWHGKVAMRISVINWSTDHADIDTSMDAILHTLEVKRARRTRVSS